MELVLLVPSFLLTAFIDALPVCIGVDMHVHSHALPVCECRCVAHARFLGAALIDGQCMAACMMDGRGAHDARMGAHVRWGFSLASSDGERV